MLARRAAGDFWWGRGAAQPAHMACAGPSSVSGSAVDILVVRHSDGTLKSTDWHAVFERKAPGRVSLLLNGEHLPDVHMHADGELVPARFGTGESSGNGTQPPLAFLENLVASGKLCEAENALQYTLEDGSSAQAYIYFWHAKTPAVVFDVDGTVTISDGAALATHLLSPAFFLAPLCPSTSGRRPVRRRPRPRGQPDRPAVHPPGHLRVCVRGAAAPPRSR